MDKDSPIVVTAADRMATCLRTQHVPSLESTWGTWWPRVAHAQNPWTAYLSSLAQDGQVAE